MARTPSPLCSLPVLLVGVLALATRASADIFGVQSTTIPHVPAADCPRVSSLDFDSGGRYGSPIVLFSVAPLDSAAYVVAWSVNYTTSWVAPVSLGVVCDRVWSFPRSYFSPNPATTLVCEEKGSECSSVHVFSVVNAGGMPWDVRLNVTEVASLVSNKHACKVEGVGRREQLGKIVIYTSGDGNYGNRFLFSLDDNSLKLVGTGSLRGPMLNPELQVNATWAVGAVYDPTTARYSLVKDEFYSGKLSTFEVGADRPVPLLQQGANNGYYVTGNKQGLTFHAFAYDLWDTHPQSHTIGDTTFFDNDVFGQPLYLAELDSTLFLQGAYLSNNYRPGDPNPISNIMQTHTTTESFNTVIPMIDQSHAMRARGPMTVGNDVYGVHVLYATSQEQAGKSDCLVQTMSYGLPVATSPWGGSALLSRREAVLTAPAE